MKVAVKLLYSWLESSKSEKLLDAKAGNFNSSVNYLKHWFDYDWFGFAQYTHPGYQLIEDLTSLRRRFNMKRSSLDPNAMNQSDERKKYFGTRSCVLIAPYHK